MEILIPLAFFAMIAALVIVPRYFRSLERQKMADTLRVAIEKGQPLPTEVIEAMSSNVRSPARQPTPQRDLRTGVIWVAVALGMIVIGIIAGFEDPDSTYWFIGLAALPGFIGLAFVALGLMNKPRS